MDGLQVGDKIRQLLAEANMTEKDLAELTGRSVDIVRRWERGKLFPHINDIAEMSSIFEKPVSYFFDIKNDGCVQTEVFIGKCGGDGQLYFLFNEYKKLIGALIRRTSYSFGGPICWRCHFANIENMLQRWKETHHCVEREWEIEEAERFYGYLYGYIGIEEQEV